MNAYIRERVGLENDDGEMNVTNVLHSSVGTCSKRLIREDRCLESWQIDQGKSRDSHDLDPKVDILLDADDTDP